MWFPLHISVEEKLELRAKITDAGVIYLPTEIRRSFGKHVRLIPDSIAAILFPADADLEDVQDSVNVILQDIQLRIKRSKRRQGTATGQHSGEG